MKRRLASLCFEVPSVVRFLTRVVDGLAQGRSALVAIPGGLDVEATRQALVHECWGRIDLPRTLQASELGNDDSPEVEIARQLNLQWPRMSMPRTAENLATLEGLPDALQILGMEKLSAAARSRWLVWLSTWSQVSHSVRDQGRRPMAVCVITNAQDVTTNLPRPDTHLSIHHWWGLPSALEARLLCRLASDSPAGLQARWREHVLPALVGWDLDLAHSLWDACLGGTNAVLERLNACAGRRHWTAEGLSRVGAGRVRAGLAGDDGAPPASSLPLWSMGALGWTPEFGLELSPAALAVLNRNSEIRHRLWRGQAELILPQVDRTRMALCQHLTKHYKDGWQNMDEVKPLLRREAYEVKTDPLACGWGFLVEVLGLPKMIAESSWLPVARAAQTLRNELSHYHPVAFRDYVEFQHALARQATAERPQR